MAKRKIETEFAFDIGDVVRLKTWAYTPAKYAWAPTGEPAYRAERHSIVFQIVELKAVVCEGGLQRMYIGRHSDQAGNCSPDYTVFQESELELVEPLPVRPKEADDKAAT